MSRFADWITRAFVMEAQQAAARAGTGYAPSVEYHPDLINGFCAKCKLTGAISYAKGMPIKLMDRLMGGKAVTFPSPICPKCKGRTFVPLDLDGEQYDALEIIRQAQINSVNILKRPKEEQS